MVFSSISKGRCFGLCVGCWLGFGFGFFFFYRALLPFSFEDCFFNHFKKVGALVCFLGVGLGLGLVFFFFFNALLLSLTFRNDTFINLSRIGLDFVLEWSFHQFQKVGALVCVLGVGLGLGLVFFHTLTPYS